MRHCITSILALILSTTLWAADTPATTDTSNDDGLNQQLGYGYSSSYGRNYSHSYSHSYHHNGGHGYHPGFHSYGSYRPSYPGWHGYSFPSHNWSYPRTTAWSANYGYPGYTYPGYTYSTPSYSYAYWSPQTTYQYQYRWRQYDNGTVFRYWDTRGTNFTTWTDNDGVTFNLGSGFPTDLISSEADKLSMNLGAKQAATTSPATAQPVPTVTPTPPPIQVEDDGLTSSFGKK